LPNLVGLDKLPIGTYFRTTLTQRWGKLRRYTKECAIVDLAPLDKVQYSTPEHVKGQWEVRAIHPNLKVLV
jgi:hypothetical protein